MPSPVWLFTVLAIALTAAAVVLSGLAWQDRKRRSIYVRAAVACGVLTVGAVVGAVAVRPARRPAIVADFVNDYVEPMGSDTFLDIASISK